MDAWKESAEGRGRVVLVSGEPGIGKTRLATETALVARRNGALVLAGRCDEELGLPYQPFVEALRFQVDTRRRPSDRVVRAASRASWRGSCPSSPIACPASTPRCVATPRPSARACSKR